MIPVNAVRDADGIVRLLRVERHPAGYFYVDHEGDRWRVVKRPRGERTSATWTVVARVARRVA